MQILSAINPRGHSKKNPIAALAGPAIDNETNLNQTTPKTHSLCKKASTPSNSRKEQN
jgi:hypothetical protein